MRIDGYHIPKSSFLSMEKDTGIIINEILKNNRLKKLLYYTTSDAMEKPNLTEDESLSLLGTNIKIVPKLYVDGSVLNYVLINFDNFIPSENPEFRDNTVQFDIICHFDQWNLKDYALRPYKIAGEIDSMFNLKKLTGIGYLEFMGATQIVLTDEFAGLCLMYRTVHGGEDEKYMPTYPDKNSGKIKEEQFIKEFKDYISK